MIVWFYFLALTLAAHLDWNSTDVSLFTLAKAATCSGASELQKDVFFGYWSGTKTDDNKNQALDAVHLYQNWLRSFPDRESFKYQSGNIVGYMWVGSMVQNTGFAENTIKVLEDEINRNGIPNMLYIEYVDGDPMKGFGVALDTGGSQNLGNMQRAVKLWSEGKSFNTKTGYKIYSGKTVCYLSYSDRKPIENDSEAGPCNYVKVKSGELIATTAGVNGESLQGYNPKLDFSSLFVDQPVCKSVGTSPDLAPSKNSDGSCHQYTVQSGDSCGAIVAPYYPLSADDLDTYNSETYQWFGCGDLRADQIICLSDGTPPRPASDPDAECGPLAPGDLYMADCPLNACCSEYGRCGYTSDYCEVTDSSTGAPGTTGCYSNCGYGSLPTKKANSYRRTTYWMDSSYGSHMDPKDIESKYEIVHYSFATINSDFSISVGDGFNEFKTIAAKKVLALGGGDSYSASMFKKGVTSDYQSKFSQSIIDFVRSNNLDGIHFDWEHPSSLEEGQKYLDLIEIVKTDFSDKLVSIALPSSYYLLQNYPINDLDKHMDYFVSMTYDYYGQWNYGGDGIGCHVDKRLIEESIKMVVKSGVNTKKVYGGLANYARTYRLSDTSCTDYGCPFTGPDSGALAGSLTNSPGILSVNELMAIPNSERTRRTDSASHCDIMTYNDGHDWAAFMKTSAKNSLDQWFDDIGLGGSALWLENYELPVDNAF